MRIFAKNHWKKLSLIVLVTMLTILGISHETTAQQTTQTSWTGNVHLRWIESTVSGVVYIYTEEPIVGVCSPNQVNQGRYKLSPQSNVSATTEGFERTYRMLLTAYLGGHTTNMRVYLQESDGVCYVERAQLKL